MKSKKGNKRLDEKIFRKIAQILPQLFLWTIYKLFFQYKEIFNVKNQFYRTN